MVTLQEALVAERAKRQQDEADSVTRQQIGRAVLEALADRLNAEPLPGWLFILDGQEICVFRIHAGAREQVGTWTVDNDMRLVTEDQMTEWITVESAARVIEEAIQITAKLIVDAETSAGVIAKERPPAASGSGDVVRLPPRL
jgi:hypothetical protein